MHKVLCGWGWKQNSFVGEGGHLKATEKNNNQKSKVQEKKNEANDAVLWSKSKKGVVAEEELLLWFKNKIGSFGLETLVAI